MTMKMKVKDLFKRKPKNKRKERGGVNELIAALKRNTDTPVFINVDRDSGRVRHTKSGFDFSLTYKGQTVFVEAKADTKLSDFQKLTQRMIESAGGRYLICTFSTDEDGRQVFELSASSAKRSIKHAHPAPFFA